MALTSKQEFEMYSDIKVIKNNCLVCRSQVKNLEERLKFLENRYWLLYGITLVVSVFLPILLQHFLNRTI